VSIETASPEDTTIEGVVTGDRIIGEAGLEAVATVGATRGDEGTGGAGVTGIVLVGAVIEGAVIPKGGTEVVAEDDNAAVTEAIAAGPAAMAGWS